MDYSKTDPIDRRDPPRCHLLYSASHWSLAHATRSYVIFTLVYAKAPGEFGRWWACKSTRRHKCSVRGGFVALHGLQGQLIGDLGGVRVIGLGLRCVADRVSSRPGTFADVTFLISVGSWGLFELGVVLWYFVRCINYYLLPKECCKKGITFRWRASLWHYE